MQAAQAQYEPMKLADMRISPWHTCPTLVYTPDLVPGKRYPLLVCFHGRSIAGKDPSKIFREGITRQIKEGRKIAAVNKKDGKRYEFIVVAPLSTSWSFYPQHTASFLDDVIKHYPVDTTRIYLTGYSAGGWSVESAKTHSPEVSRRIAACVTMSPPITEKDYRSRYKLVADANIHTWYFAGLQDGSTLGNTRVFMDSTNKYKTGLVKLTEYPGGHSGWHTFLNPSWRENGMSIYEWLLQYTTQTDKR
ncbi:hypothetical protein [Chitinophaga solisilvae]|uniref:Peptidase S9 prolyl oligopeptidase catalytic domain-containing protein n=1 Tax=Chitinophaga solisilvae TaxID=1233460 RepID=A0A9Q5DAE7_9BACT|nr:hypothetical protein [Chitinophaga solisilvae]NSL86700.1 hypothetical protein [Chitinophaga solisilvae]